MTDFLRPIKTTTLSDAWGLVQRHEFDLKRRSGQWQRQIRETYDRGDGAAVLLCDFADKSVVLIRQFRYPAFYRGEDPFVIEVCAGKLDGEDAETCVRKEAIEETGYQLGEVTRLYNCFMSPGSVTERVTLFLAEIAGPAPSVGGGLENEGEDIEVLRIPFGDALRMVEAGQITDAKTILLLQYAELKSLFA